MSCRCRRAMAEARRRSEVPSLPAEAIFSRLTMLRRAVRLSPMAEMVAIVTLDPQGGEVKLTVPAKFL